ncbi:MAG: alpha/beta fold hydrolase, partial [Gammaproteobacteria bacterium]|nr:alpha/beta fold hydrolase [Gammaproteobacteria bacterium]
MNRVSDKRLPNRQVLFALFLLMTFTTADARLGETPGQTVSAGECVVLLHGLGRTSRSMHKLDSALGAAGFFPVNLDYPSREKSIEELAMQVVQRGLDRCSTLQSKSVHFVTHSMGGILVRYFLGYRKPGNLGRVVMLSPPNRGSEAADLLQSSPFYQWINGPAGLQLVTGSDGLP